MPVWSRLNVGDSAAGVYGTLLTLSVLVGLSIDKASAGAMVITVAVTSVIFWLAHVHAGMTARWVGASTRPGAAAVVDSMRHETPMLVSAVPSVALLVLAWTGLIGLSLAVWLSLGIGVLALVLWGVLIARRAQLGPLGMAIVSGINLALGLVIVVLKALLH